VCDPIIDTHRVYTDFTYFTVSDTDMCLTPRDTHTHTHTHIYIYIYIERERDDVYYENDYLILKW